MGIASLVLGVLAVIFAFAGAFLTFIPFLGALLSFGSPILALVGAVLGGVAYSRAKEESAETGVPLAGLIVSIIAFFPGLFVALTCGVCNSMCTAGSMAPHPDGSPNAPYWLVDGGNVVISPGITPPPVPPTPNPVPDPNAPPDPTAAPDPNAPPPDPDAPPPAFPPPPPDPTTSP